MILVCVLASRIFPVNKNSCRIFLISFLYCWLATCDSQSSLDRVAKLFLNKTHTNYRDLLGICLLGMFICWRILARKILKCKIHYQFGGIRMEILPQLSNRSEQHLWAQLELYPLKHLKYISKTVLLKYEHWNIKSHPFGL